MQIYENFQFFMSVAKSSISAHYLQSGHPKVYYQAPIPAFDPN